MMSYGTFVSNQCITKVHCTTNEVKAHANFITGTACTYVSK